MNRGQEVYDYRAEPILKELLSAKDFGQYTDKASKDLQLCFLTTNDITGGNSGSPIFMVRESSLVWLSMATGIAFLAT